MPTRQIAGIKRELSDWSLETEAMNLAKVDIPMPMRAPVMFKTVASNC